MKKLLLVTASLCLFSLNGKSQNLKNEIGLSLGTLKVTTFKSCGSIDNGTSIQSILYSSNSNQTTLPKLYYARQLYKRWKVRFNFEYSTLENDRSDDLLYDNIYDPSPGYELVGHRSKRHNSIIGLGIQFDILRRKKINFYTAIENGFSVNNWTTSIKRQHIESKRIIEQRLSGRSTQQNQLVLITGGNYLFSNNVSLTYEIGLSENHFHAVSRLSVNYHF